MFDIPKNQKPWLKISARKIFKKKSEMHVSPLKKVIKKYILFVTLLNELLIPEYALNYHCFLNVNCITALGYKQSMISYVLQARNPVSVKWGQSVLL